MDILAPSPGEADLASRVERLEREVAALRREGGAAKRYMRTFSVMPDDEVSREAARLGAAYRKRQPKC